MGNLYLEVLPVSDNQLHKKRSLHLRQIKKLIWSYIFLLIFEGALRKWLLPSLATPLLLIRDPIAILLIVKSIQIKLLRLNMIIFLMFISTCLSVIITLLFSHGNLFVALYGARIWLVHFPVIYIIGNVFSKQDVIKVGEFFVWINIGMTLLVAVQFFSPQSAWVNRGIANDINGSGFGGALGYYRVPGTFSFTNGLSYFYGMVASFVFFFWLDFKKYQARKLMLYISTLCLLMSIPLSISRTVFFEISLSIFFVLIVVWRKPKVFFTIISLLVFFILFFFILKNFIFFQTATDAFIERFTTANQNEGGVKGVLVDRFLGGMVGALNSENFDFWGKGIGMGTNVGSQLLVGKSLFLISEGEWGRVIGEMGVILGMCIILCRLSLGINLIIKSFKNISFNNALPWLMSSFSFLILIQGPCAQPTTLGFAILSTGLTMAALKTPKKKILNEDNSY